MKMNLFNFEFGTFQQKDNDLILKIDKNRFSYDKLHELDDIKKGNPFFLKVKEIKEKDNQVIIQYLIPNEYKNLLQIKREPKAIKTAIAKQIINDDILSNLKNSIEYVSLNPANIWYLPMKNVKYAYQANNLMPLDHKHSHLEKYKAVILFCLTGAPYEKLLEEPKFANPKHDELLDQIISAKDIKQLKTTVNNIDDYVEYTEWEHVQAKQKKNKQKMWLSIGIVALTGLALVGLENKSWEQKYQNLQDKNKLEVKRVRNEVYLENALKHKKYTKAKVYMEKMDYSKAEQIKVYKKYGAYQQVLNIKPKELNSIINELYKEGKEKKILDLTLPSKATSNQNQILVAYKDIINYDTNKLEQDGTLIDNPTILLRIGEAYVNHNDLDDAELLETRLIQKSSIKGKYLKAQINLAQENQDLDNAKKDLDNANKIDNKDKSKGDKVKSAQSEVDTAENKQKSYQKQVKKLAKKVGDD